MCKSVPTASAIRQHRSRAGSGHVDVPVPSGACRPWEPARVRGNPSNLATVQEGRLAGFIGGGGGGERIAKKGQYLQAAHCSSISGPCREEGAREMYFFRSRQRSAPAPIAGMRHFPPGRTTRLLPAKPKEPLQLQPPDKV